MAKNAAIPSARSAVVDNKRLRSASTRWPSVMVRPRPRDHGFPGGSLGEWRAGGEFLGERLGVFDRIVDQHGDTRVREGVGVERVADDERARTRATHRPPA